MPFHKCVEDYEIGGIAGGIKLSQLNLGLLSERQFIFPSFILLFFLYFLKRKSSPEREYTVIVFIERII